MENEENICFDVEPEEDQEVLTIDQKLQNTLKLLKPEMDYFEKTRIAKSFIENCLIDEEFSDSAANSYIKLKLAKEFGFEGRDGSKAVTIILNRYKDLALAKMSARKTKVQKPVQKIIVSSTTSNIVNDIIMKWEDYVYPYDYSVKNGKIVKTVEQMNFKTGDVETIDKDVSLTPFILCGKSAGEKTYYTIRYEINGSYNEFVVPMEDLLDNNTMQRVLTSHGINIPASLKFEANDYIGAFIHQLGNNLKTISVTLQNGWNEDFSVFTMGKIGITKDGIVKINTLVDTDKHILPFVQKGKIECWVEGASPILAHDKPRFLFYHGMSSALIKILSVEQDIFDVNGSTSTGKTGTLAVISSAIANPSCKPDGYALEVGNSYNPLMAHAAGLRDMPVIFEEVTGTARREAVIEAAYNIANGVDKTRSQKNGKVRNDVQEIRSTVLISCEHPISEEVKTAGGRQRVKDISKVIPESVENGEMVDKTKNIILENYGFFFPIYIQKIMNDIPRVKELCKIARTKIIDNVNDFSNENRATVGRSKHIFASKLVAGYLCEEIFKEIGIPAKSKEETEKIVNDMFKECVLNNPVELDYIKALKDIASWVATSNEFFKDNKYDTRKDIAGEVTETTIKIFNSALTKRFKATTGLSVSSVKKDLFREKLTDKETKSIRVNDSRADGIEINRKLMEIKLGLFEEKPSLKNLSAEMVHSEIIRTIHFLTHNLCHESVDALKLELILGYDVQKHLDKLAEKGKVIKHPNGGYV